MSKPRKRKPRRVLRDWRKLFDQVTKGERLEMVCLMLKTIESRQNADMKTTRHVSGTVGGL
jgi:hypothetical protein